MRDRLYSLSKLSPGKQSVQCVSYESTNLTFCTNASTFESRDFCTPPLPLNWGRGVICILWGTAIDLHLHLYRQDGFSRMRIALAHSTCAQQLRIVVAHSSCAKQLRISAAHSRAKQLRITRAHSSCTPQLQTAVAFWVHRVAFCHSVSFLNPRKGQIWNNICRLRGFPPSFAPLSFFLRGSAAKLLTLTQSWLTYRIKRGDKVFETVVLCIHRGLSWLRVNAMELCLWDYGPCVQRLNHYLTISSGTVDFLFSEIQGTKEK